MRGNIIKFNIFLEKSIINELERDISFGCVNKFTNGSHNDMTYHTFLKSSKAIRDSLEKISWEKIDNFHKLRKKGKEVEKNMFTATKGVNTHKGLIFLLMILAYFYTKYGYIENLEKEIIKFSHPLLEDYKKEEKAIIWKKEKIKDIRYYPLTAFKEIIELSKNDYENSFENNLLSLKLISITDDTTTLARSNLETLRYLQKEASNILETKAYNKEKIKKEMQKLNKYYLDNNLSSGGVADIFTIIKLLSYIRKDLYEKNISKFNPK